MKRSVPTKNSPRRHEDTKLLYLRVFVVNITTFMTPPFSQLAADLDDIAQQGLYRSRRVIESPQGINLEIDGRNIVNFCSNDYLGLANHPDVVKAFKAGADRYGVGSGSAHLICGHSAAHHALEEELAAFTGRDRALLFSTGYMANIGVISALLGRGDAVFEDRLNHASLLDGGLLSGARFKRYAHADVADLERKSGKSRRQQADRYRWRIQHGWRFCAAGGIGCCRKKT